MIVSQTEDGIKKLHSEQQQVENLLVNMAHHRDRLESRVQAANQNMERLEQVLAVIENVQEQMR